MKTRGIVRVLRAIAGLALLVLLLLLVNRWLADYRSAKPAEKGGTATSTISPSKKKAASKPGTTTASAGAKSTQRNSIEVLMDGVNFRASPEAGALVIRGLSKGEKLTLLKKQDSWYKCRDSEGVAGWLSANPSYAKLVD